MPPPKLLTLGDLAQLTNVPEHRVKYAVDAFDIQPRQRVGILRVWSQEDVPLVKAALARIASNRPAAATA